MLKGNRYVTHVIAPELPKRGFDQLFFYTVADKSLNDKKFYWGRGVTSFSENFINELLAKNEIQKLNVKEYPLLLNDNETLWVDKKGIIYKADLNFPSINRKKIGLLEIEVKK